MNVSRCQRLIKVVILDIVVLWNKMYYDGYGLNKYVEI